jgi:Retroviral aspartyl protease
VEGEMIDEQYMSKEETYEEEIHEEEPKEEQLITLSSSTTGGTIKSLKYKGQLGHILICVLIDTSVTHSFINPVLVKELKIKTEPQSVKVFRSAGGEKLVIDKLCPQVKFLLQN